LKLFQIEWRDSIDSINYKLDSFIERIVNWQDETDSRLSQIENNSKKMLTRIEQLEASMCIAENNQSNIIINPSEDDNTKPNQQLHPVSNLDYEIKMRKVIRSEIRERELIEEKRNNIIIYGIPEMPSDCSRYCKQIIEEIIAETYPSARPVSYERVGRPTDRNRPIRLILRSHVDKIEMLRNKRYLRESAKYQSTYLSSDLTYNQRLKLKENLTKQKVHSILNETIPESPIQLTKSSNVQTSRGSTASTRKDLTKAQ
jgi:hypothetical protein